MNPNDLQQLAVWKHHCTEPGDRSSVEDYADAEEVVKERTDSQNMNPRTLEKGQKIGYNPTGAEEERVVGIVRRHYGGNVDVGVIVAMPDDPGIEEKVPYENIQAVEPQS